MRCGLSKGVATLKGSPYTDVSPAAGRPFQGRRVAVALALLVSTSCGRRESASTAAAQAAPTAAPAVAAGSAPHGDHNPHHGGVVMMKGDDLHYEVVLDPGGGNHRVYFTDAVREDLPASVASGVAITIRRPHAADERVAMQIDEAGESWIGSGRPVEAPAATTARVAFTIRGEPYWIDLPFAAAK